MPSNPNRVEAADTPTRMLMSVHSLLTTKSLGLEQAPGLFGKSSMLRLAVASVVAGILQLLTFQVVADLVVGRLANIQNRLSLEML